MPSLKDLRNRIASVKSTRKITSAMKMVAASKLRRAQEQAENARPYAQIMGAMLKRVAAGIEISEKSSPLLRGTGSDQTHLLVVVSSDRGLCGGFNTYAVREARRHIRELQAAGKTVKIITLGRKARDLLRRDYGALIVQSFEDLSKPKLNFAVANAVCEKILSLFAHDEFDTCTVIYNRFQSVIAQVPTARQLIPLSLDAVVGANDNAVAASAAPEQQIYDFEPAEEKILDELLPRNLAVQLYQTLLDSAAGEQAARMTAMDNATRNAGDMINQLTLNYNRARQAFITKELIEIISGAEAL